MEKMRTPVVTGGDPTAIEAELEAHRQQLLQQAAEVDTAHWQLDSTLCEYNTTHGFTPAGNHPSRMGEVRRRGGDLGMELVRDGERAPRLSVAKPTYSSPGQEHEGG